MLTYVIQDENLTLQQSLSKNGMGTKMFGVSVLVFNATFNNISVISWWSVLLVVETRVTGENY